MGKSALGCAGAIVLAILIGAASIGGSYNSLVRLDQATQAQWAQVQNAYQRRADLVPNLVATVKGAANFEKSTMVEVTEARARVNQVAPAAMGDILKDPAAFQRYQQAQQGLSSALSRLLAVAENYPQLKATANFRDLQATGDVLNCVRALSICARPSWLGPRSCTGRKRRFPRPPPSGLPTPQTSCRPKRYKL